MELQTKIYIYLPIEQDCVTVGNLFNVDWELVKDNFMSKKNVKKKVTDQEIEKIFSKLVPEGFDKEISSILDQGYKIEVTDTGMGIKKLWISKKTDQALKPVFVRSNTMYSTFAIAIEIFHKTLEANIAFNFSDWFGGDKYPVWSYCYDCQTRLDWLIDNFGVDLILDKTVEGKYQIEFEKSENEKIKILCNRITVC